MMKMDLLLWKVMRAGGTDEPDGSDEKKLKNKSLQKIKTLKCPKFYKTSDPAIFYTIRTMPTIEN